MMMKSDEVFWMLLSFCALPAEEQNSYFSREIPSRDDAFVMWPTKNNLIALNLALSEYYLPWRDQMDDDNCISLEEFNSTREKFVSTVFFDHGPGILCREAFFGGAEWARLRQLATKAICESGMGFYPIPRPICFDELVELVDPDADDHFKKTKTSIKDGVRHVVDYYPSGLIRQEIYLIENEIAITRTYLAEGDVIERYFLGMAEVALEKYAASLKFFPKMERPMSAKMKKKS